MKSQEDEDTVFWNTKIYSLVNMYQFSERPAATTFETCETSFRREWQLVCLD